MSVEASCRKFLDAIATKLSSFYIFDYRYSGGPTIGDVIEAIKGSYWDLRVAKKEHPQIDEDEFTTIIKKGQPLVKY